MGKILKSLLKTANTEYRKNVPTALFQTIKVIVMWMVINTQRVRVYRKIINDKEHLTTFCPCPPTNYPHQPLWLPPLNGLISPHKLALPHRFFPKEDFALKCHIAAFPIHNHDAKDRDGAEREWPRQRTKAGKNVKCWMRTSGVVRFQIPCWPWTIRDIDWLM